MTDKRKPTYDIDAFKTYHVPSPVGVLYVKFTADVVAEFLLLSFKEKDDE